jgi:rare lipoprotein A (peptidoglycan hydrolase)
MLGIWTRCRYADRSVRLHEIDEQMDRQAATEPSDAKRRRDTRTTVKGNMETMMQPPRTLKESQYPRTLKAAFGPYAKLHIENRRPWYETGWFWPVVLATAVVLWLAMSLVLSYEVVAKERKARETAQAHASWYGPGFHGRKTASGERFNQHALTAAHKTLPFGTLLIVTHKGKTTVVRVNDRGPFVHGREIDLSAAAAREIGLRGVGIVSINQIGG